MQGSGWQWRGKLHFKRGGDEMKEEQTQKTIVQGDLLWERRNRKEKYVKNVICKHLP